MSAPALSELARADLETRLLEAEETLRAIREGEVDALVVQGSRTDRVFTLEDNAQSYRAFMEAMDIGAGAFDDAGRLLYANQALGEAPDFGTISIRSPVRRSSASSPRRRPIGSRPK